MDVARLIGMIAVFAAGSAQAAEPIDDAAPYIYERCLESFGASGSLEAEFAGTRFVPVAYAPATSFGAKQAYAHPSLGATRVWETREDSGDRVQLGCTMIIDGGNAVKQFNRIAVELAEETNTKIGQHVGKQLRDYITSGSGGLRESIKIGDATLSHVMTRGIPDNPNKGYVLSVFLSRPK